MTRTKRLTAIRCATALLLLSAGGNLAAAADSTPRGVDLAQLKGWSILIANDSIASEIYAAEEFQQLFRQASGVTLPIVSRIEEWDRHVYIGPGSTMRASPVGFTVDDLGPEDLRIVVRNDAIAIAGGRPRGTLYGVYTFLEDYLGVRFLTPDHTHVPPVGEQRVVGPLDRVHRPPFANFRYASFRTAQKNPVFAVRHRNNAGHHEPRFGGVSPFININHSFYRQIPYNEYKDSHPEYFSLWGGERRKGHNCLTNPDLVPIVTRAVLKVAGLPSGVDRRNFSVSQNDTVSQYCQCEKCAAIDGREESHMGALLNFVNLVADEVAKTHPKLEIGTLAFGFSRKPPKTLECRPNVEINLTSYGRCHVHAIEDPDCPPNVEFFGELEKWSRICKHLYVWDYHFLAGHTLLPYPDLYLMKPNFAAQIKRGVRGTFFQAEYSIDFFELSDLRYYLASRLMWNNELDDREIVEEFVRLHYAEAAPPIYRFVEMLHEHYRDIEVCHVKWDPHGLAVDEAQARAGLNLFVEAKALARSEEVKTRVEKASICAYRAVLDPIFKLGKEKEGEKKVDPALAERLRPAVKEFFRLCEKYGLGPTGSGYAFGFSEPTRELLEGILAGSAPK